MILQRSVHVIMRLFTYNIYNTKKMTHNVNCGLGGDDVSM